ncbi:MAG: resolvase [Gammaproteobacteria bacterium CG_4_10_14_0_8_um_filter_38_16]|nr:MAG: resolvase [Gammaproteobacteria bacterium CG_4_10_14_0_8_um_filter_38_16]PJA03007.1 MAG: resolvase [Gammaproteobacteria bacterium CG_4_10_14_0_2_um_filter_38_22]PJB09774.1 MAG: resolvase [Gammaproteobacteria bacterium CG_4_9_14_3_um_filter_38_9]
MLIGYARVSTADQYLGMQEDALKGAGCEDIFKDIVSGAKTARPGLHSAISHLRKGDTLVVWRLDRLGRSLAHLIETVKELNDQGIGFKSLQESIDTTTSGGQLIFHIFGALAQFERELIRERTQAGLKAARVRGRMGGRPVQLNTQEIRKLKKHYDKGDLSVMEICKLFNITKPTLYRYLKNEKQKKLKQPSDKKSYES